MGQTVIGVFENTTDAHQAVEKLTSNGFSRSSIDVSENDDNNRVATDADTHEEDSISRFFNNLFGNNDQSKYYSEVTRRSSSLVTVHAQSKDEAQRAVDILDEYGAIDIDERAAQYGYKGQQSGSDYQSDFNKENQDVSDKSRTGDSKTIPIIEEEAHIGKREVQTGGAKIRSRVVEKPIEETLRLRHEKVNIERNPVDRKATEKDMKYFQDGEIDATERKEVPVVNKEARVVEEVKINKEVGERQEKVRENVKKTEVDIDKNYDKKSDKDYDKDDFRNKSDRDNPNRDRNL